MFSDDPTDKINAVIECGVLEPKVKTGYFPTPPALVERMIDLAELDSNHVILEPSAGQGHIADLICEAVNISHDAIDVCEILPENEEILKDKWYRPYGFFEAMALASTRKYERILMNPPFEMQQDITHVETAFNLLVDGGILVAIMSSGVMFRENKKTVAFRENILDKYAVSIEDNPAGSFKESGTMVNTVMIKLVKE